MRKIGMRVVMLLLGLGVLLVPFATQVKAQDEGETSTQIYTVPVKNVRAEVMAYWLMPRRDVSPAPFKTDKNGGIAGVAVTQMFEFPGVESLTANAAKNELWIKGTPEAVRKLKEFVEFLDRPIRNVEIKTQFVEVDAAEMFGLGIEINPDGGINTVTFGQAFRDKLQTLIATKRAAVFQSAQITTMNNSASNMSWNSYATLPPTDLQVTPTIQNDDTVTLYLTPNIKALTPFSETKPSWYVSTVANIKNGDVIVVATKQNAINGRLILLLVSAQIVQDQIALLD